MIVIRMNGGNKDKARERIGRRSRVNKNYDSINVW